MSRSLFDMTSKAQKGQEGLSVVVVEPIMIWCSGGPASGGVSPPLLLYKYQRFMATLSAVFNEGGCKVDKTKVMLAV